MWEDGTVNPRSFKTTNHSEWRDDAANWTTNGEADVPPSESTEMGDDLIFTANGGGRIQLGHDHARLAHSLTFLGDYDLIGDNVTFDVTSGNVTVTDDYYVTVEAFMHSSHDVVSKHGTGHLLLLGGADAVVVYSGTLGGGTLNLGQVRVGGGRLAPGTSIGTMQTSTVVVEPRATLEIELGADGSHDVLQSKVAFINENLDVRLLDEFVTPDRGTTQSLPIVQATRFLQGQFDGGGQRHLNDGVFYDVSYDTLAVNLDLTAALPGDANGDGRVDAIDLGIWQNHRFSAGDWADGDFSGDGFVDGSDFNIWSKYRFQQTIGRTLPNATFPQAALAAPADDAIPAIISAAATDTINLDVRDRSLSIVTEAAARDGEKPERRRVRTVERRGRSNGPESGQKEARWDALVDDLFALGSGVL